MSLTVVSTAWGFPPTTAVALLPAEDTIDSETGGRDGIDVEVVDELVVGAAVVVEFCVADAAGTVVLDAAEPA